MTNTKLILGLSITAILIIGSGGFNASHAMPDFINIDISNSANPTDFPFGIECSDSNNVYMTLFKQGAIVEIDKTTEQPKIIRDPTARGASGNDFYSIEQNPINGELAMNKRDSGVLVVYNPTTGLWRHVSLIEQIVHPNVSYPNGFNHAPNTISVQEPSGQRIYNFGINSWGEVIHHNGFFWVLLDYKLTFSSEANSIGVTDKEFHGVVKIDPDRFTMTHIPLSGVDMRGIAKDPNQANILWFTSMNDNKLIEFDTSSEQILQTTQLPSGTLPRGIAVDNTHVYLAMNQAGGQNVNSLIMKIDKFDTNTGQSTIDTLQKNSVFGTFSVFIIGNELYWTDESKNIGIINISNNNIRTHIPTAHADANHFGCLAKGGEIWIAGKGSAVVTKLSTSTLENNGGENRQWMTKPTFGKLWTTHEQFVSEGFGWSDQSITVTDNWHTDFEMVDIPTGQEMKFYAKVYAEKGLKIQEFCFGVPNVGEGRFAESCVEVHYENHAIDEKTIEEIKVVQETPVIEVVNAEFDRVDCKPADKWKSNCDATIVTLKFNEPLKDKVMMIKAIDGKGRITETYLNEGFDVNGVQFSELPTDRIASPIKYEKPIIVTQVEKYSNLWVSEDGKVFDKNDFGTYRWINQDTSRHTDAGEPKDRMHSEFYKKILWAEKNAKKIFDSSEIQAVLGEATPTPIDLDGDEREKTLQSLGWYYAN